MLTARCKRALTCCVAMASLVLASGTSPPRVVSADEPVRSDPAVERARHDVKMLDELYKSAVVSITDKYPKGQPAIMVAKDVFKAMEKGKYHSARLVDATGNPLGEGNTPQTDFEKRAAEAMKAGKTYVEEVQGNGNDRRFLAATVVPAVHRRCAECHGVKQGELLGFIRYDLPLR